jgi:hypothetical protein
MRYFYLQLRVCAIKILAFFKEPIICIVPFISEFIMWKPNLIIFLYYTYNIGQSYQTLISLFFWFLLLSLAISKYKQYFLMLQTLKLNNKKRKKSSFYEEKSLVGLTVLRTHMSYHAAQIYFLKNLNYIFFISFYKFSIGVSLCYCCTILL